MSRVVIRSRTAFLAGLVLLLPACARSFTRPVGEGDLAGGSGGSSGDNSGGITGQNPSGSYFWYAGESAGNGWFGTEGYDYSSGYGGGYAVTGGYGYSGYGYAGATGYGGYGGMYGWCGDGIVSGDEQCDGVNLGGESCWSLGFPAGGNLYCYWDSCTFDVSMCYPGICGDGFIDPYEECDGDNLGWASCESLGFGGGPLYCDTNSCTYDTRWCIFCGDGRIDEGEQCEGPDLNGQSCISLGYIGGELRCDPHECTFDESGCAVCGDGVVQVGENCDGSNLRGRTCSSLGLGGGLLRCDPAVCLYDTGGCDASDGPRCGNGVAERGEQCDGNDMLNATCEHLGYDGGQLGCNPSTCRYNTSGCILEQPPPNEACSRCIDQNCAEAIENCLSDPACVAGIDCVPLSCGPEANVMCALDCFGGMGSGMVPAQKAVTMNTCIFSFCGPACIGPL